MPNGNYLNIGAWAEIGDGATVGNEAKIGNRVIVNTSPLQIQGPIYIVYPHSPGKIGVGCQIHTIAEWMATAGDNFYVKENNC